MAKTHFSGPIVSTGGFQTLEAGPALSIIATGSIAVDPASLAAATCAETQLTITGAAVGDILVWAVPASLEAGLSFSGSRVSATDTVQLRLCNVTSGAVDGTSRSWKYIVLRAA